MAPRIAFAIVFALACGAASSDEAVSQAPPADLSAVLNPGTAQAAAALGNKSSLVG